nr:MAG TPA: hypothetical protein [Caudoviricetes sp.]
MFHKISFVIIPSGVLPVNNVVALSTCVLLLISIGIYG